MVGKLKETCDCVLKVLNGLPFDTCCSSFCFCRLQRIAKDGRTVLGAKNILKVSPITLSIIMIHREKSSCELLKHVALSVSDLISKALVYSGMNPQNHKRIAFRLLFGQTDRPEQCTRQVRSFFTTFHMTGVFNPSVRYLCAKHVPGCFC